MFILYPSLEAITRRTARTRWCHADRRPVGGSLAGTLNDDIDDASVAISNFNPGVWDFGDFGGAANDGVRLVIPAPASAALLGLGGIVAARRRRA